ncbi:hypothetical protein Q7C_2051 [Methylophaga frappieri]|uniref:Uncharacterized protein n=1 Tax=Methylophaga frappieri (strain ATCC BAA-2434 / DSM 25690 / JAM7) TaxID=754477 RepID=I1YJU7_METFJ|nr:hypothetical protein Q7C_2051 [Methylophaga frappieri]
MHGLLRAAWSQAVDNRCCRRPNYAGLAWRESLLNQHRFWQLSLLDTNVVGVENLP